MVKEGQALKTVSVVIVNWKTPQDLLECLTSIYLFEKDAKDLEIFVVDNGSEDESVELVKREFNCVNIIANSQNLGFSKACNQAIVRSQGDFVVLLNPDTLITEDALSRLANELAADDDVGAVGPKILNLDGTLQLACRRSFPSLKSAFYKLSSVSKFFPKSKSVSEYNLSFLDADQPADVDCLSGSCLMFRRVLIDEIGLLDEATFMHAEDMDFCFRIKSAGYRVAYLPSSVIFHKKGVASSKRPFRTAIDLHRGMSWFYKKHMACNHSNFINWSVYAAIQLRLIAYLSVLFIRIGYARMHGILKSSCLLGSERSSDPKRDRLPQALVGIVAVVIQAGCGSGAPGDALVTSRRGTVNIEGLKVGVPENIVKDAVFTFALDEKPAAMTGNKTQYLSRTRDGKGGQYCVQCREGSCFRVDVVYVEPIGAEQAMETMKRLLPDAASSPEPMKKAGRGNTSTFDCGDSFRGELAFSGANCERVGLVSVWKKKVVKQPKLPD